MHKARTLRQNKVLLRCERARMREKESMTSMVRPKRNKKEKEIEEPNEEWNS